MKARRILPVLPCILLLAGLHAQEPGSGRPEVKELFHQAERAKAEGRVAEAEEIMRRVKQLKAGRHEEGAPKIDAAKREAAIREIEELHRIGKHEEAERIKRQLAGPGRPPGGPGPIAAERERLAHIGQAIEHARAAGLQDEAARLEQAARRMQEELAHRDATRRGEPTPPDVPPAAIRDMHEAIERMQGQMEKLSRAIGELREQVQALQRGAEKHNPPQW